MTTKNVKWKSSRYSAGSGCGDKPLPMSQWDAHYDYGFKDGRGRKVGASLTVATNWEPILNKDGWTKGYKRNGYEGMLHGARDGKRFGPIQVKTRKVYASPAEARADVLARAVASAKRRER